jgi:hypothetical protein
LLVLIVVKTVTVLVHAHRWLQQSEKGRVAEQRVLELLASGSRSAVRAFRTIVLRMQTRFGWSLTRRNDFEN